MKRFVPKAVFYEPDTAKYEFGRTMLAKYMNAGIPMEKIENHNRIPELASRPNSEFARMKSYLILGVRKTHKYTPNCKVSDWLVPFTSSGCAAMCLYCYLVCTYNKCSYLRVFVNREQMMDKLLNTARTSDEEETFEIGSNSDLILENTVTDNLSYVIPEFGKLERGYITMPTKFAMVEPLLELDHRRRTIVRMSVNPESIITNIELGTSSLDDRIKAINMLAEADYRLGILVAPVILVDGWEGLYTDLIARLADELTVKAKNGLFFEVIFLTYGYVQQKINEEAFKNAPNLYTKETMAPRGRGKYSYKKHIKEFAGDLIRSSIEEHFPGSEIIYIV
jgi:spore photoproduct lyase